MTLQTYIDAWSESIDQIIGLGLDDELGALRTSLPGWSVRDVVAHLVHLEEAIARGEANDAVAGLSNPGISSEYTQRGVDALAAVPVAELLDRLSSAVAERRAQLTPAPTDPSAAADRSLAGKGWNWDTLLGNRAVDAWLHEQDIRRAIGKPGSLGALGAHVTVHRLAGGLPFVVGKRAAAPQHHPVRFEIEGEVPLSRTIVVDESGLAAVTQADPATTIAMSTETYTRLAAGREPIETFEVRVTGDDELAARILAVFSVTP